MGFLHKQQDVVLPFDNEFSGVQDSAYYYSNQSVISPLCLLQQYVVGEA